MESLSTQVVETATNAQSIGASLIISIISLTISLFVFAKDLWHERLRIDVTLVKWFASIANGQPFFLWLVIQNNSSLPFSISKIELKGKAEPLQKILDWATRRIKIVKCIFQNYTRIRQKLIKRLGLSHPKYPGAVYRVDVCVPVPLYAVSQGSKQLLAGNVNGNPEKNIYIAKRNVNFREHYYT